MRVSVIVLALVCATGAARGDVTVYVDRYGAIAENGAHVPPYAGTSQAWQQIVACVKRRFEPFAVEIVDHRPAELPYITAVVGGRPSLLGFDDRTTNGIGAFSGEVIPDAVVYTFSEVGPGETDVANLCAVTVHEVGHALGLDHSYLCGDVMSYFHDRCGEPRFLDVDAPCGEDKPRTCEVAHDATQNSYRRLGRLVGYRLAEPGTATPDDDDPFDVEDTAGADRMIQALTSAIRGTVRAAPSS